MLRPEPGGGHEAAHSARRQDGQKVTRKKCHSQALHPSTVGYLSRPTARVGALERELTEAREQQTATSDVLGVVSRSPGDLKPVFAAMLANIVRVCNATLGSVYRVEDGVFRFIAMHNTLPAHAEISRDLPFLPSAKHYFSRMIASKAVDQIADFSAETGYLERRPEYVASVEAGRIRTALFVPMLKGDELIGAFALARQEVRPFSDKQIDLVQNFAAQAVIAIENTRLLNELRQRTDDLCESLEQQTATSEVLKVISSSPGELETVFSAMLANAARVCGAAHGALYLREADGFRVAALDNVSAAYAEVRRRLGIIRPPPASPLGGVATTKQVTHITDLTATQAYADRNPFIVAAVELGGYRTAVCRADAQGGRADRRDHHRAHRSSPIHR